MPFLQEPAPDAASLNWKEGCVMLRMDARVQKEGADHESSNLLPPEQRR